MALPTRWSEPPTLPSFLHIVLTILGVVGIIAGSFETMWIVKYNDWYNMSKGFMIGFSVWLLISSILIFLSGLQGSLLADDPSKLSTRLFVSLAMVVLLDVAIWIVFAFLATSPFWILYFIVVFVLEFYVLILRTCCKPRAIQGGNVELPIVNPSNIRPPYSNY